MDEFFLQVSELARAQVGHWRFIPNGRSRPCMPCVRKWCGLSNRQRRMPGDKKLLIRWWRGSICSPPKLNSAARSPKCMRAFFHYRHLGMFPREFLCTAYKCFRRFY